jgi:hypothetical protein
MPRIVEEKDFNGVLRKIERLGLTPLVDELRDVLTNFRLEVMERVDSNGGAALRVLIDDRFRAVGGWTQKQTGDVDWTKCHIVNGTRVCLGIEIQVSARSDLLVMDIVHLRKAIEEGVIDVGILVVPSDRLSTFMTDRAPCMSDAVRHVGHAKAQDLPLLLVAIEHDGPGAALIKRKKRPSKE